jgi:hypothetical protein
MILHRHLWMSGEGYMAQEAELKPRRGATGIMERPRGDAHAQN